jgi:hypothetical protein
MARLFRLESKFAPGRETEGREQSSLAVQPITKGRAFWRRAGECKRGSAWLPPLGCCLALCDESVQAYSDLSWLGLIGFGNFYFKYSFAIGCFDVIVFHGLR